MKSILRRLNSFSEQLNTDTVSLCLVFLCIFAVFCHYAVTKIILVVCGISLLFLPGAFKKVFLHKSAYFAFSFLALTVITAVYFKNQKGLSLSVIFILVAIIGFYLRSIMTSELFEWALDLAMFGCIFVFIGSVITKIANWNVPDFRSVLWFYNSNYLGAIMAGCITICAYKEVTKQGKSIINYLLAIGCAICIYFCGSLFAIVEVLTGVAVLLTLSKKHRLLRIFLIICAVGCFTLFLFPSLLPRLSESTSTTDSRILIWQDTILHIPDSPLFGKGFFSYRLLDDVRFLSSHSHNFVLDSLLSFGIVGTVLLSAFFFFYYRIAFLCNQLLRKSKINALILALSAGVLIHATTDMTMVWSQTALFYAFILAGIGADEKKVDIIRATYHK